MISNPPAPLYRTLARFPVLVVGLTGAAFSAIKTGRDTVFFHEVGLSQLPLAYIWSEFGLAIVAVLHLGAIRRWGSRRVRTGAFVGAAALFAAFVPLVGAGNAAVVQVLFPAVPVVFAGLFATAWLLAGDLFEGAERPVVLRVYVRAGASAMVGGVAGALMSKMLAGLAGPAYLVALGAALLAAAATVCSRAHARRPDLHGTMPATPAATWPRPREAASEMLRLMGQPYARLLLGMSALASLAGMYVEFQFYAAAIDSGRASASFFANYYIFLSLVALGFQLVVTPWLQTRFGLSRALLVLPVGVLGGAGLVVLTSSVLSQTIFRLVENSLKNSIHRSSWEQVFLPYSRERRATVKMMVDGTVARVAGLIGALGLHALISRGATTSLILWLAVALVFIAAIWILVTYWLARSPHPAAAIANGGAFAAAGLDPCRDAIRLPDS